MAVKVRSTPARVDRVAIVHHEAMRALAGHTHAKLLHRPLSGRMLGHVPVQQSARADVEHDKDVDKSKPCRHRHEEIAGQHVAGMIADERAPGLRPRSWDGPNVVFACSVSRCGAKGRCRASAPVLPRSAPRPRSG